MGFQKINDILRNGLLTAESKYKRLTNYHDLRGKCGSTKERHRATLKGMLSDRETKVSDIVDFCASVGILIGKIPLYKSDNENEENKQKISRNI